MPALINGMNIDKYRAGQRRADNELDKRDLVSLGLKN